MGIINETIHLRCTAPGSTLTETTGFGDDTLKIRHFKRPDKAFLITAWNKNNLAGGLTQIFSQMCHDQAVGIYFNSNLDNIPKLPISNKPEFVPGETIRVLKTGSAVGGEIESTALMIHYENVPNVESDFIDTSQLARYGENVLSAPYSFSVSLGQFSSGVKVSANDASINIFKKNKKYALVGMFSNSNILSALIQGKCTGNVKWGYTNFWGGSYEQVSWYWKLSHYLGIKTIPVFKGEDASSTYFYVSNNVTSASVKITFSFVELPLIEFE